MTDTGDDNKFPYSVGYKKPPSKSQFKKGHSGNPRGKLRGQKSLKTELVEELGARVTIPLSGKQQTLSKQSIMIKRWVSDAVNGNARARDQVIRLVGEFELAQPKNPNDPIGAAKDTELLERFKEEVIANIKKATK